MFGRIGNTAHENTRSCNAAIHSLWFRASTKLSIWFLKVLIQVNTIVRIIANASCWKPTSTQIQKVIRAHSSAVIHALPSLKLPDACEIANSTNTAKKNTIGK